MVWGVSSSSAPTLSSFPTTSCITSQWAVCAVFLSIIGLAMAELGSAVPTSGGLYYRTFMFSSRKWRCLLSWIVGCKETVFSPPLQTSSICVSDSNTIGNITGVASVDWGLAVQIMAAASIGSGLKFTATVAQTL